MYALHPQVKALVKWADSAELNLKISGLSGSSCALITASLFKERPHTQILVMDDADEAAYLYNDLKQILSPDEVFLFSFIIQKSHKTESARHCQWDIAYRSAEPAG